LGGLPTPQQALPPQWRSYPRLIAKPSGKITLEFALDVAETTEGFQKATVWHCFVFGPFGVVVIA